LDGLLSKFKQDPDFEKRQELGKFLLRHIDDLTKEERARYDQLVAELSQTTPKT